MMFRLQKHKYYWRVRAWAHSLVFIRDKLLYRVRERRKRFSESASVFLVLARRVLVGLFLAVAAVVALVLLDSKVLGFQGRGWPEYLQDLLNAYKMLQLQLVHHADDLQVLFTVIASVSGVFLGLYFTAVSVVASVSFARVYSGIREHFLRDKGGEMYIKILAGVTTASLLILAYLSTGHIPGVITAATIFCFGCFGVIAFVLLGFRTFYFLNPTVLSDYILVQLRKTAKSASVDGARWHKDTFQRHFMKHASAELSNLESTIELAVREPYLRKDSLVPIIHSSFRFLRFYLKCKHRIPSNSYWYRRVPTYKNCFLCDDAELFMAIQTGTSIRPEETPEHFWLETDAIDIISRSLAQLEITDNQDIIFNSLISSQSYLEDLGRSLNVTEGRRLLDTFVSPIEDSLLRLRSKRSELQNKTFLAILDATKLCYLSLVLGLFKEIDSWSVETIKSQIGKVSWKTRVGIYRQGFPPVLLSHLEWMKSCLDFEYGVEGHLVSPKWYIQQLVFSKLLDQVRKSLDEVLAITEEVFITKGRFLVESKHFVVAAIHCQRGLELCSKLKAHIETVKRVSKDFYTFRVDQDMPWPEFDWSEIAKRVARSRRDISGVLAKCLPTFSLMERDREFPDLFGQVYNVICWDSYQALRLNDTDQFSELFPVVASASLMATQRLTIELNEWLPESQIAITGDPILDLLELSGYALIYSELFDDPKNWSSCKTTWDALITSHSSPKDLINYLVSLHEIRFGDGRISPRQMIRTRWKIELDKTLREMNVISGSFLDPTHHNSEVRRCHKSKLIRRLCGNGEHEPLISAAEVFIVQHLVKLPEADDVSFKDRFGLLEDPPDECEEK